MDKSEIQKFRVSESEKKIIKRKAEMLSISSSEYLRLCALNKNIQTLVNKDLITCINRIGANINQIL